MNPSHTYACYSLDQDTRLSSSSGAVFSLLAENVLSKQGVVYGVAMSEDCYAAEFVRVTDAAEFARLRGSKYLQAKVGKTYQQVKADLLAGKYVLFSGTGCQVNGLKSFLGKDYDDLLCVDVICHGAPSPALWRKYAAYQEQVNGGKLKNINFRCKDDSWVDFGMKEALADIPQDGLKKLYVSKDEDPYMQMFLRDYCLRPSCYECVAKNVKMSDLTIADFWGIDDVAPEMNDGKGTSLMLIRTEKGKQMFETISSGLKKKEVSYEDGVKGNPAEYRSCGRPPQRDTFFDDMKALAFAELEKKYVAPPEPSLGERICREISNGVQTLLKMIGGGVRTERREGYGLLFVFRV